MTYPVANCRSNGKWHICVGLLSFSSVCNNRTLTSDQLSRRASSRIHSRGRLTVNLPAAARFIDFNPNRVSISSTVELKFFGHRCIIAAPMIVWFTYPTFISSPSYRWAATRLGPWTAIAGTLNNLHRHPRPPGMSILQIMKHSYWHLTDAFLVAYRQRRDLGSNTLTSTIWCLVMQL